MAIDRLDNRPTPTAAQPAAARDHQGDAPIQVPPTGNRLVGVRTPYDDAPPQLREWAAGVLGGAPVAVLPRIGGMSPAVAVTLIGADGSRLFVKAVGSVVNPDTPGHFRHEISALSALAPAPYRSRLVAAYDDGDWVGIALEDVDGRHPDWASADDRAAVLGVVRAQTDELTPAPARTPTSSVRDAVAKYLETMVTATPEDLAVLPPWASAGLPHLTELTRGCLDHQRDESYCHWDIRHDNILIRRRDEQPLLVDWGMSRRGPHWGDLVVYALEWVDIPEFDVIVDTGRLTSSEERDVTGLLAAIGCYLLIVSARPAPAGLPTINAFRRQVGTASMEGVRRRLGILGT